MQLYVFTGPRVQCAVCSVQCAVCSVLKLHRACTVWWVSRACFVHMPCVCACARAMSRCVGLVRVRELLKLRRAKDSGARTVTTLRAATNQALQNPQTLENMAAGVVMRRPFTGARRDASTQTT
jgi:hypothetical protein